VRPRGASCIEDQYDPKPRSRPLRSHWPMRHLAYLSTRFAGDHIAPCRGPRYSRVWTAAVIDGGFIGLRRHRSQQGLADVARDAYCVGPSAEKTPLRRESGRAKTADDREFTRSLGVADREKGMDGWRVRARERAQLAAWEGRERGISAKIKASGGRNRKRGEEADIKVDNQFRCQRWRKNPSPPPSG